MRNDQKEDVHYLSYSLRNISVIIELCIKMHFTLYHNIMVHKNEFL